MCDFDLKVGPPDMYDNHIKLKEARNESRKMQQGFENLEERLEQNKNKNSRLEQDVKNFQERERHLEKVAILTKKRPWIVRDLSVSGVVQYYTPVLNKEIQ